MNKEILYEPELFTEEDCNTLVKTVFDNISLKHVTVWRDTKTLWVQNILNKFEILSKVWIINQFTERHFKKFLYPEVIQLVEWPPGSSQDPHKDEARETTVATSITYLNTNYSGGEIYFPDEDIKLKPKTGDTVIFDGQKYLHGVSEVNEGTRLTLAIWYTDNYKNSIFKDYVDVRR